MAKHIKINERVSETDIYVFGKNPETGLFTYSRPIYTEEASVVAEAVNKAIKEDYNNARGFRGGLAVDTKTGALYNMNAFKGISANRKLMEQSKSSLWLPTIEEGFLLDDAKMLPLERLIDFGVAVFSADAPNKEMADVLVEEAKKRNYTLPVLASFKSLGLKDGGKEYGVMPEFVSESGLITGADAEKILMRFYFLNSGVRRLFHYRGGFWGAYWGGDLGSFGAGCRVERISGEASAKNLQGMINSQIEQNFTKQRRDLEEKLENVSAKEKEIVESAEAILGR